MLRHLFFSVERDLTERDLQCYAPNANRVPTLLQPKQWFNVDCAWRIDVSVGVEPTTIGQRKDHLVAFGSVRRAKEEISHEVYEPARMAWLHRILTLAGAVQPGSELRNQFRFVDAKRFAPDTCLWPRPAGICLSTRTKCFTAEGRVKIECDPPSIPYFGRRRCHTVPQSSVSSCPALLTTARQGCSRSNRPEAWPSFKFRPQP